MRFLASTSAYSCSLTRAAAVAFSVPKATSDNGSRMQFAGTTAVFPGAADAETVAGFAALAAGAAEIVCADADVEVSNAKPAKAARNDVIVGSPLLLV